MFRILNSKTLKNIFIQFIYKLNYEEKEKQKMII